MNQMLYKNATIDSGSVYPFYTIIVNDGGSDGGTNLILNIGIESNAQTVTDGLEAALKTLGATLAAPSGFVLKSVSKVTVSTVDL